MLPNSQITSCSDLYVLKSFLTHHNNTFSVVCFLHVFIYWLRPCRWRHPGRPSVALYLSTRWPRSAACYKLTLCVCFGVVICKLLYSSSGVHFPWSHETYLFCFERVEMTPDETTDSVNTHLLEYRVNNAQTSVWRMPEQTPWNYCQVLSCFISYTPNFKYNYESFI